MSFIAETSLLLILGHSVMLYGLLNFVQLQTAVGVPADRRASDPRPDHP